MEKIQMLVALLSRVSSIPHFSFGVTTALGLCIDTLIKTDRVSNMSDLHITKMLNQ